LSPHSSRITGPEPPLPLIRPHPPTSQLAPSPDGTHRRIIPADRSRVFPLVLLGYVRRRSRPRFRPSGGPRPAPSQHQGPPLRSRRHALELATARVLLGVGKRSGTPVTVFAPSESDKLSRETYSNSCSRCSHPQAPRPPPRWHSHPRRLSGWWLKNIAGRRGGIPLCDPPLPVPRIRREREPGFASRLRVPLRFTSHLTASAGVSPQAIPLAWVKGPGTGRLPGTPTPAAPPALGATPEKEITL
jgi:hypothetical protein